MRRPPPSPASITLMEATLEWLRWLEPELGKLVWVGGVMHRIVALGGTATAIPSVGASGTTGSVLLGLVGAAIIWKYIYDTPGAGQAEGAGQAQPGNQAQAAQ